MLNFELQFWRVRYCAGYPLSSKSILNVKTRTYPFSNTKDTFCWHSRLPKYGTSLPNTLYVLWCGFSVKSHSVHYIPRCLDPWAFPCCKRQEEKDFRTKKKILIAAWLWVLKVQIVFYCINFCLPLSAFGGNPARYKYNLLQGERLALYHEN